MAVKKPGSKKTIGKAKPIAPLLLLQRIGLVAKAFGQKVEKQNNLDDALHHFEADAKHEVELYDKKFGKNYTPKAYNIIDEVAKPLIQSYAGYPVMLELHILSHAEALDAVTETSSVDDDMSALESVEDESVKEVKEFERTRGVKLGADPIDIVNAVLEKAQELGEQQ